MDDPCPVKIRGLIPSLNTPFDEGGELDIDSLRRVVDYTAEHGCAGLLAIAVAGETRSLTPDEVDTISAVVVEQANARLPVILGVSADDQDERLRRAARARTLGADGILCQAPAAPDAQARANWLAAIADAGPDLLMVQDLDWSGPGLALDEIVTLFDRIEQFQCLKIEVVPAGPKYSAVLEATDGRLHVSGGWAAAHMMDAMARGVHALMNTEFEPVYGAIYRLYMAGRVEEAYALFERLLPILVFTHQHLDVSIRFHKMQRRENGIFTTDVCRPPTRPLDPVQRAEAERYLAVARELISEAPKAERHAGSLQDV
ncbi:MAG: dihydrodipicolinate synthase family protein [Rhodospirillales bacterium]|nr:dihydrodipicolinate synthase family protein [Rhodospirillales bacterium]